MFPGVGDTSLPIPLMSEILDDVKAGYEPGMLGRVPFSVRYFRGRIHDDVRRYLLDSSKVEPEDGMFTVRVGGPPDRDGDVFVYIIDPGTGKQASTWFHVEAASVKRTI